MNYRAKNIAAIVCVIAVFLFTSNCKKEIETANITLYMTDAPFPFEYMEAAYMTISQVEIVNENTLNNPYIILSSEEFTINLLELNNGRVLTISSGEIPVGRYVSMRLFISSAEVLMKDGRIFDLKVPSGSQTGLKLLFNEVLNIESGESKELLLDVDISRSFVPLGNIETAAGIKGFNFKPVIKVSDLSFAGSLTGIVNNAVPQSLEGVTLSLFSDNKLYTCSFTEVNGEYTFIGLDPGIYDLTAEKSGYINQTIEGIEIESDKYTFLNIELTEE